MNTLFELEKYLNFEFSSGGDTGEDYKLFQNKYISYLRSICKQNSWELVKIGHNHYCFSTFIRNAENKHIYLSIGDVRWTNDWHDRILIRTATSDKDYTGGRNNYTLLPSLERAISYMFANENWRNN